MGSERDLSKFWCWHEACPDYGKKDAGNIVLKENYGKNNIALLKCRTCGHCFSEMRGTPFFGLITPWEEVVRTLAEIPVKGSIRGVARSSGHDKSTIDDELLIFLSRYSHLITGTHLRKDWLMSTASWKHHNMQE